MKHLDLDIWISWPFILERTLLLVITLTAAQARALIEARGKRAHSQVTVRTGSIQSKYLDESDQRLKVILPQGNKANDADNLLPLDLLHRFSTTPHSSRATTPHRART